jgi:hypothetical protein
MIHLVKPRPVSLGYPARDRQAPFRAQMPGTALTARSVNPRA